MSNIDFETFGIDTSSGLSPKELVMPKTPWLSPEKVTEVREAIKSAMAGYQGSYLKFDEELALKLGVTREQVRHQRSHHLRMIKTSRGTPQKTKDKIKAVAKHIRDNNFKLTNTQLQTYSRKISGQGMREGPVKKALEMARRMQVGAVQRTVATSKSRTEIYSVDDVAKKYGITDEAVRDAMRRKRLTPDKVVGKTVLFFGDTLAAWRQSVQDFKDNRRSVVSGGNTVVIQKLDEILTLLRK